MRRLHNYRGFTLIETILVIVILSISAAALVRMFGQLGRSLNINHDIQAAAQMAQECGEHLLSARREFGFAMNTIVDCSALTAFNGNGPPAVTLTTSYTGAGCPSGANCKHFLINATYDIGASVVMLVVAEY